MEKFYVNKDIYIYPESYKKLIELNLVDFDVWYLIESGQATRRYYDLKERYPNRNLIPFARRDDNDDIACFEVGKGSKVQLIHDFTSEGFEQKKEFNDFWEWFDFVIKEMIDYNRSQDIE
ncbi:hypothetical protein H1Z61_16870 [Bacillus aquiflavi]|uniref:SMI1/KNR4 family protein n=1 Tax=Bacillus aquiflavi TaxID=2672567 RepID=A0A6B3W1N7_9BACI|nr:hypothetical protein [Bacillus aquiflavi]MBA4538752.1 hypothetical protein [Bacillus aquiflavi]NEY83152.1 hypothetical protein [Bacillus aquiflavi]